MPPRLLLFLLYLLGFCGLLSPNALPAAPTPVVLVYADSTALSSPESNFAKRRAQGFAKDLQCIGLSASVFSDTALSKALSAPTTVAHLIGFHAPQGPQIACLDDYLQRGGKLVLHACDSPVLAQRLGLQPPKLLRAPANAPWTHFTVLPSSSSAATSKTLQQAPARIQHTTHTILVSSSISANTKPVASWQTAQPTASTPPQPAIFQHKNGFWIGSLVGIEDTPIVRGRWLLALSAQLSPALWKHVAEYLENNLWEPFKTSNLAATQHKLLRAVPTEREQRLNDLLASLSHLESQKRTAMKQGRIAESIVPLWQQQELLYQAYACTYPLPKPKARTLLPPKPMLCAWVPSGSSLYPNDWRGSLAVLAHSGITDLFVMVHAPVFSVHSKQPATQSRAFRKSLENLSAAVDASRASGIRIHAWIPLLNLQGMSQPEKDAFVKAGRALTNEHQMPVHWAAPAHPLNRTQIAQFITALAEQTHVDGIHLDYLRYPLVNSLMGSQDATRFAKHFGEPFPNWPQCVMPKGSHRARYNHVRAQDTRECLEVIQDALKKSRPRTLLTAAVYGSYPHCIETVGQDWPQWVHQNLVDAVVPMNYSASLKEFENLCKKQRHQIPSHRIIAGIGVVAYESTLNPIQVIQQLHISRQLGLRGAALYPLQPQLLPALHLATASEPKKW